MRVFAIIALFFITMLTACRGVDDSTEHQAEWRQVLEHKRAADQPDAPVDRKQVWADALRGFVEKHPDHTRARELWSLMQLEFADDLMRIGRVHQAARFYHAVLTHDRANERALKGWEAAGRRKAISRERLRAIQPGMRSREVASRLGRPLPGWIHHLERSSTSFDAWYYRTPQGLAAIHFREGRVIAIEENSSARLGRLAS